MLSVRVTIGGESEEDVRNAATVMGVNTLALNTEGPVKLYGQRNICDDDVLKAQDERKDEEQYAVNLNRRVNALREG